MMRTADELRAELLAKKQKRQEEELKKEQTLAKARDAVADMVFLGLSFREILQRTSVAPETLENLFKELRLPYRMPAQIYEAPKTYAYQMPKPRDRFGTKRWSAGFFHVSDSEASDDEAPSMDVDEDFEDQDALQGSDSDSESQDELEEDNEEAVEGTDRMDVDTDIGGLNSSAVPSHSPPSSEETEKALNEVQLKIKAMQEKMRKLRDPAHAKQRLEAVSQQRSFWETRRSEVQYQIESMHLSAMSSQIGATRAEIKQLRSRLTMERAALQRAVEKQHELKVQMYRIQTHLIPLDNEYTRLQRLAGEARPWSEDASATDPEIAVAEEPRVADSEVLAIEEREVVDLTEEPENSEDGLEVDEPLVVNSPELVIEEAEIGAVEPAKEPLANETEQQGSVGHEWRYSSPLHILSSHRFSPLADVFAPMYNSRYVSSDRYFCKTEASGKDCTDAACEDVHAVDFNPPKPEVLRRLADCTIGEPKTFLKGLANEICALEKVSAEFDPREVANVIIKYRRGLDPMRFLDWRELQSEL